MATYNQSKRATLGEGLLKFWALILLALILVIFIFLFQFNKPSTATITSAESSVAADITLINYLKTPITIKKGGEEMIMPINEFIIEYFHTPSMAKEEFRDAIYPKTKAIFDSYPNIKWKILISPRPEEKASPPFIISDKSANTGTTPPLVPFFASSCVTLPTLYADGTLKVQLLLINTASADDRIDEQMYRFNQLTDMSLC